MSKESILYIDDESFNLATFEAIFYKNYNVFTCEEALDSLNILEKNTNIKVVITDQRMPQISGLEIIKKISEKFPDIICIILTAFAEIETTLNAINQGGIYRFILKPWKKEEMLITIENAIETFNLRFENKQLIQNIKKADSLKTAFLANISHEIRTPLNGIIGFSSLLCDENLRKEEKNEYFEIIKANSDRLLKIIDNVVEISKAETDNLSLVYNNISLINLLDFFNYAFKNEIVKKNLKFDINFIPNLDVIYSDQFILKNILTHLIENAIKFTEQGEIILSYKLTDNKEFIQFEISDTGNGISEELLDEIFIPFRQLDFASTRKYGGNGLGLSLVKAYIKKLGGRIWVESKLNIGSTFYFTIPFIQNKEVKLKHSFSEIKIKKVLIIDFSNESVLFLVKLFQKLNIENEVLSDCNQLFSISFEKKYFNVVLIDIKTCNLESQISVTKIKEVLPNALLIALISNNHQVSELNLIENGFDFFLEKPLNKHEIINLFSKN